MDNIITVIPARLGATRLPNKPLALIHGKPMIQRVWEQAMKANLGPVVVAAGDPEIVEVIEAQGGTALLTDPNLPSGSDRVWHALTQFDPENTFNIILNLQGDVPDIDPNLLMGACTPFKDSTVDITTLVSPFDNLEEAQNPNLVKAILAQSNRCLYFTRGVPYGGPPYYHHIGVYGFRRNSLEQFMNLPRSPLEIKESLEQLRALENNMIIGAAIVDQIPHSIDTPEDLAELNALMKEAL